MAALNGIPLVEGWGALTLVAFGPIAGLIALVSTVEPMTAVTWALAIVAVLNWFLGRWVNKRGAIDRLLGERAKHRIVGMPMQWFSIVLLGLFLFCLVVPADGA